MEAGMKKAKSKAPPSQNRGQGTKFVARLIVRATRPLPLGSSSSCLQLPGTRLFALRNEVTIAVDPIPILDQFLVRQRMRQRG